MAKDVFVGRRVVTREFKESLMGMMSDSKDQKAIKARKKTREEEWVQARFFLLHGKDGLGKTALVSQLAAIVENVSEECKSSIKQIPITFDVPMFAKSAIALNEHDIVQYLYSIVSDDALSVAEKFTEYESISRRLKHIKEKTSALFALEAKTEAAQTAASQNTDAIVGAPPPAPVDT
jgi:energy-coupling factor transporter ATP-binding protein EcfA2